MSYRARSIDDLSPRWDRASIAPSFTACISFFDAANERHTLFGNVPKDVAERIGRTLAAFADFRYVQVEYGPAIPSRPIVTSTPPTPEKT